MIEIRGEGKSDVFQALIQMPGSCGIILDNHFLATGENVWRSDDWNVESPMHVELVVEFIKSVSYTTIIIYTNLRFYQVKSLIKTLYKMEKYNLHFIVMYKDDFYDYQEHLRD